MKKINIHKTIGGLALLLASLAFSSCIKEDVNPSAGTPYSVATLYVLKELHKDSDVPLSHGLLTGAYLTTGTVISNAASGNLPAGQVMIQSSWRGLLRGIVLALDPATAATMVPGDSLVIDVNGAVLSKGEGALQITGLTAAKINKVATNRPITIRPVSVTQLNENFKEFESTLVSLTADVKPLPVTGETMTGAKTLDDGSGSTITLYTEPQATFAQERIAPNATFIGIPMAQQNEIQLRVRQRQTF